MSLQMISFANFPTHVAITNNKKAPNKYVKINANLIYSGNLHPQSRKVAVSNMKKYLRDNYDWSSVTIDKFPIQIETVLKIPINYGSVSRRKSEILWKPPTKDYIPNWDIGNYGYFWSKIFSDLIQKRNVTDTNDVIRLGIIPEDTVTYVSKEGPFTWIPCNTLEERELIFKIYD